MCPVAPLEEACRQFLLQNLGHQDILSVLTTADLHNDKILAEKCSELIYVKLVKGKTFQEFKKIEFSTLECFLRASTHGDIWVYRAVRLWAKEKCIRDGIEGNEITQSDLRDRVKSITHLMKFHEIEPYDLVSLQRECPLLSKEEAWDALSSLRHKMENERCVTMHWSE